MYDEYNMFSVCKRDGNSERIPNLLDSLGIILLVSLLMVGCHKWGQTPSWSAGDQVWFFPSSSDFWLCAHRGAGSCDNSLLETNWFPQVSSCTWILMVATGRMPRTREYKMFASILLGLLPERASRTLGVPAPGETEPNLSHYNPWGWR